MRYRAYVTRLMSQVVEFDAPEYATTEQLQEAAFGAEGLDLEPNISNKFDADGDEEIYYIENDKGKRVFGRGAEGNPE